MDETKPLGATPGDDISGLLQPHLKTRDLRNAAELEQIDQAYENFIYRRKQWPSNGSWLTEDLIRAVHKSMFGGIWAWAGHYRKEDKNIGIPWHQVTDHVGRLCADFSFWIKDAKFSPLEIASRFQHGLTFIHPFDNGNGRHARLMTDLYFRSIRHPLPQWPQIQLMKDGQDIRKKYIDSLRNADKGDFTFLMSFIQAHL